MELSRWEDGAGPPSKSRATNQARSWRALGSPKTRSRENLAVGESTELTIGRRRLNQRQKGTLDRYLFVGRCLIALGRSRFCF